LKTAPHNPTALFVRGSFRLSEERPQEAAADLAAGVAADPESVDGRLLLASAHKRQNDVDAAVLDYTEILKLRPRATVAQYQLGLLHLASGRAAKAVEYAQRAVASSPNSFEARLLLARSLVAGGDGDRAEPALRQLVRERPDDSVVRAAVGQLLL